MEPTPEYLAAPEIARSRLEAAHGAVRAVVENFNDAAHLAGKSVVHLSRDGGATFSPLDWPVHWRSWWKTLAREWPPHNVVGITADERCVRLSYFEATYDGPVYYDARYDFLTRRWHLS